MPVCLGLSASSTVTSSVPGLRYPAGIYAHVGARLRRVYIFGASVFLGNPKSMSEGPLFLE
jgi:hypothetical protein